MKPRSLGLLLPLVFAACSAPDGDRRPKRDYPFELVEGEPMYTVLPPDRIPAIDEPRFVTAAEAGEAMQPDEPVLGVVGSSGTAKAYSAWQLEGHEIVNDHLDGEPIAATW